MCGIFLWLSESDYVGSWCCWTHSMILQRAICASCNKSHVLNESYNMTIRGRHVRRITCSVFHQQLKTRRVMASQQKVVGAFIKMIRTVQGQSNLPAPYIVVGISHVNTRFYNTDITRNWSSAWKCSVTTYNMRTMAVEATYTHSPLQLSSPLRQQL